MFILPCALLTEALNAAGFSDVNYDKFESRALSTDKYVFLEDLAGTTPHIRYANRPTVQIISYAMDEDDLTAKNRALRYAFDIQAALLESVGTPFSEGGIHRVVTRVSPYRQDLAGLPYGVGRAVAQYDFILSNIEKWS